MVWVSYHVRRDESVVADMSGDAKLQRSSWKAEAIRRGDLKISGPIPITEETPLNDEEEREYAERHGINIEPAAPRPDSPASQEAQGQQPQPPPPPQTQLSGNGTDLHTASDQIVEQPQIQEDHHALRHKRSSTAIRETSEMQRHSSHPASYGTTSPFPSIPDTPSKTTPKKKRKSGLRNVFRKMFGRRSRDEHHEEEQDTFHKHSYHSSDPGLLTQSPERPKENVGGSRISEVPEMEPINPLGQHLPFPMNVNAPQETSPTHDYLTFEIPHDLNRRRASLPSAQLSQAETRALSSAWNKQASSWDERQDAESIPSPQIGIALSSPTPPEMPKHVKRRSRSAGALRELAAKGRLSTERRRSAEIRYWRTSYQSGSVYSTNTPRPRTAQTVETVRTVDTRDSVTQVPKESVAESGQAHAPTLSAHDQDISQIELPVEAFNFGNLRSDFSDDEVQELDLEQEVEHENEREHVDIPVRSANRLSIEERVKHLEDNMLNIEMSVRRLSGRSNRQTIILENAPKGRRSRNRSSSATSDREHRQSSRSSNKTLSVRHDQDSGPPSPILAPLSAVDEIEFPASRDRRSEAEGRALEPSALPRSHHSQSQSQLDAAGDVAQQLAAVYSALRNERAARKTLEEKVMNLQREVQDLHALVHKFVSASPSYPTPSPDGIVTSNEDRLSTPRASGRHHGARGLGFGDDDEDTRETVVRRFTDEARSVASSKEDVASPDVWATPKEESGAFFAKGRGEVGEKGDGSDEMF
ncbi:hypothetical protein BCR34DRAFT_232979 [Clohesyomyces aquaticus]|uniref:Uncharacterized protein n=1 Tax=Clohesyomyces aquaticus TaxID=1231657 RepID=A0A1Y1ZW24_9PLEO|nr:hypothetical protein BCR34DRAFT_232979 [Clohesyomyces aquaticus]